MRELAAWTVAFLMGLAAVAPTADAGCNAGVRVPVIAIGPFDTDGDNFENPYDSDYDQDCAQGISDYLLFVPNFGNCNTPDYDHNGDGCVGAVDFNIFRMNFGTGEYPDYPN